MCGISVIININKKQVLPQEIKGMNDLIIHRGPDGEGFYFDKNFALGHRRLSIIDLSEEGSQPMAYNDRYWISFNGEIYNYLEIRDELKLLGYTFNSQTDTEVILAAYSAWGNDCLSKFNGMWAFVIYDKLKQILFFSRDRFGVKPLYYANSGDKIYFGSEIKQLLPAFSEIKANKNTIIKSLLTSLNSFGEETYFEDVKVFPSSHYCIFNLANNEMVFNRYYQLKFNEQYFKLNEEQAEEKCLDLIKSSVEFRLRSDVKLGTCLSGGLDSSIISSIASRLYHSLSNEKFLAIHAKSTDSYNDESNFAKQVSSFLDTDLEIVEPKLDDFLKTIEDLAYTQEEPFGSPSMFMGWHIFKKAKEKGCKVMLNGQGGDEVFLGYEKYYSLILRSQSFFNFFKMLFQIKRNTNLKYSNLILYYFYFNLPSLRIHSLKKRSFLKKDVKNNFGFENIKEFNKNSKNLTDLQIFEIVNCPIPELLRYEDRNSMAHSIETRLPFLDYRVVEFGISIKPNFKINKGWSKYILRKIMEEYLPNSIIWRKDKKGFEAPEKTWITSSSDLMKREIGKSEILKNIVEMDNLLNSFDTLPLRRRWDYFAIAIWEKKFNVVWTR